MAQINVGGVVKGGLVAGLIMNVSEFILNVPVLGAQMEEDFKAHNITPPGNNEMALFTIVTFVLGLLAVYLYAAVRPRFGAGPATAAKAGILVWLLAYVYASVFFGAFGLSAWSLIAFALAWGLVECIVATMAGAYFYKEA
jgi:hypothetical protein